MTQIPDECIQLRGVKDEEALLNVVDRTSMCEWLTKGKIKVFADGRFLWQESSKMRAPFHDILCCWTEVAGADG